MRVLSLGQENPLEEGMATHSRVLAWRIPWTEEPGRLQSMGFKGSDIAKRLTIRYEHFKSSLLVKYSVGRKFSQKIRR